MRNVEIIGEGYFFPENIVTNSDLFNAGIIKENFLKKEKDDTIRILSRNKNIQELQQLDDLVLFDESVRQRTGISERRYFEQEIDSNFLGPTEFMAIKASRNALKNANKTMQDIDFVYAVTTTPSYHAPTLAQHVIGESGKGGITINEACAGFVHALIEAYRGIKSGEISTALVVASETMSRRADYKSPKDAALLGDGAGAVVLQAVEGSEKRGIISTFTGTKYLPGYAVLPEGGIFSMPGGLKGSSDILPEAVHAMKKSILEVAEKAIKEGALKSLGEIDWIIPHQANERINDRLAKATNIPLERFVKTINTYGNTSSASAVTAWALAREGKIKNCEIKRGDKIIFAAVGASFAYSGVYLIY